MSRPNNTYVDEDHFEIDNCSSDGDDDGYMIGNDSGRTGGYDSGRRSQNAAPPAPPARVRSEAVSDYVSTGPSPPVRDVSAAVSTGMSEFDMEDYQRYRAAQEAMARKAQAAAPMPAPPQRAVSEAVSQAIPSGAESVAGMSQADFEEFRNYQAAKRAMAQRAQAAAPMPAPPQRMLSEAVSNSDYEVPMSPPAQRVPAGIQVDMNGVVMSPPSRSGSLESPASRGRMDSTPPEKGPDASAALLHKLNKMEAAILQDRNSLQSPETQHVLRQLSLMKVDLLSPGGGGGDMDYMSPGGGDDRSVYSSRSRRSYVGGGGSIVSGVGAPPIYSDGSVGGNSYERYPPQQNSFESYRRPSMASQRQGSFRSLEQNSFGSYHRQGSVTGGSVTGGSITGSVGYGQTPQERWEQGARSVRSNFRPPLRVPSVAPQAGQEIVFEDEAASAFPMMDRSVVVGGGDAGSIAVSTLPSQGPSTLAGAGGAKSVFTNARSERRRKALEDKMFDGAGYQPDLIIEPKKGPPGLGTVIWDVFSSIMTFPIHDKMICKEGVAAKKAWREKTATFVLFLLVSCFFVAAVTIIPIFICVESDVYFDEEQVGKKGWTSIHGKVYSMKDYVLLHPGGRSHIEKHFGADASKIFPRLPPVELPSYCLSPFLNETVYNETNSLGLQNVTCGYQTEEDILQYGSEDGACHKTVVGSEGLDSYFEDYYKGELVMPGWDLNKMEMDWLLIDDAVYNVTSYIDRLKVEGTFKVNTDHATNENAYLTRELHVLIVNQRNQDATLVFKNLFPDVEDQESVKFCLDELFYHAKVDTRYNATCQRISIAQYSIAGFMAVLALIQVGCSLIYVARRPPMVRDEDKMAAVMVMVPCYNESAAELRKTIDSVLANDYPDENKLLVVVADGVMTGKGEKMSCPETLGSILGFHFDIHHKGYEYESVGAKTLNEASIYSGNYKNTKHPDKTLKYIVVVKQGTKEERGTARAGNRGKRDSQLLLFGILNRLQYNRRPTDLDLKFADAINEMDLPLNVMEFLMAIDADTRVSEDAMKYFVHKMDHDASVLACCGETQVDNKMQSFTTMCQVFEYYSAHHLKKAFESVFGCVTCLPGCFTMYRLYTEDQEPLLCCDNVFSEYSRNDIQSLHERNLYELGEDRMLTTLMLTEFHQMKLSFVPEAVCWTIVPHTLQILKSQRRRWINSTIHNMLELLKVRTMCGISFFSMKTVVVFDLFSTFLLPSGCVYLYYIIVEAILSPEPLGPLQIIAFAYIGLMMLPFVFRAQWAYFFHFLIFLVGGVPLFYFYLPIYAFWHMDDLSWGKTRQVQSTPVKRADVPHPGQAASAATSRESNSLSKDSNSLSKDNLSETDLTDLDSQTQRSLTTSNGDGSLRGRRTEDLAKIEEGEAESQAVSSQGVGSHDISSQDVASHDASFALNDVPTPLREEVSVTDIASHGVASRDISALSSVADLESQLADKSRAESSSFPKSMFSADTGDITLPQNNYSKKKKLNNTQAAGY